MGSAQQSLPLPGHAIAYALNRRTYRGQRPRPSAMNRASFPSRDEAAVVPLVLSTGEGKA